MILLFYVWMCLIFGTTFLAIKLGVDAGASPFFSAGLRFFGAGALLFLLMHIKERVPLVLLVSRDLFLIGTGLTFGTFATLYWAEQFVSSGTAAVLSATAPMMILGMQTFGLKQKMQPSAMMGCAVGIIGVFLLILPNLSLSMNAHWLSGCFAIILGQVFYAGGTLYARRSKETAVSPIALNAVQMMHGGLLLFALSFFTENEQLSSLSQPVFLLSLLYLTVVGSMIGHTLYYYLVTKTNPVFPSTWLYISPLIAVMAGFLFYGEELSRMTLIGSITIIAGTILVNAEALKSLARKRSLARKPY
ncbi:EamA family transporter [Domibacillus indicus]|uniref:DMT family transporter n=1 Tax=Domibacillus indicus TaxID=1437523 RepID=UPI002040E792|nr:EamA family transporter [Domibacillus indicus]MCM3789256.1 EamA family transporter [Domibacillus indicus]